MNSVYKRLILAVLLLEALNFLLLLMMELISYNGFSQRSQYFNKSEPGIFPKISSRFSVRAALGLTIVLSFEMALLLVARLANSLEPGASEEAPDMLVVSVLKPMSTSKSTSMAAMSGGLCKVAELILCLNVANDFFLLILACSCGNETDASMGLDKRLVSATFREYM